MPCDGMSPSGQKSTVVEVGCSHLEQNEQQSRNQFNCLRDEQPQRLRWSRVRVAAGTAKITTMNRMPRSMAACPKIGWGTEKMLQRDPQVACHSCLSQVDRPGSRYSTIFRSGDFTHGRPRRRLFHGIAWSVPDQSDRWTHMFETPCPRLSANESQELGKSRSIDG